MFNQDSIYFVHQKTQLDIKFIGSLLFSFLAVVSLSACRQDEPSQAAPSSPRATMVEVITLSPSEVAMKRVLSGRAHAYAEAEIRPQVTGLIEKRLFTEGQIVKRGQALYQINASEYSARVASVRADLDGAIANTDAARETVNRYKRLIDINAVSRQVYDQAVAVMKRSEADIGIRKAALRTAEINLSRTKVTAPISGRIGRSSVSVGALVTSNQITPLAQVFQLDPIYLDLTVASNEVLSWKQDVASGVIQANKDGAVPVTVRLENDTTYPHIGTLEFGEVSVDQAAGTVVLRAKVPNPDGLLLPGMFVSAEFSGGVYKNAFLVPQKAVLRKPTGDAYVYVVSTENTAQQKVLELVGVKNNKWIVINGLKNGDKIIISGLQNVRNDAPVNIGSEPQSPESSPVSDNVLTKK